MSSVGELLRWGQGQLAGSEEAAGDAQALLAHVLGRDRSWLFAWSEQDVTARDEASYRELLAQRLRGRPIAHITGQRAFWTLQLRVDESTLIPRPETEHLVEQALQLGGADRPLRVLDLGTGSGAVALALASERRHWRITACDRSKAALAVARRNARDLGLGKLELVLSDWFEAIDGRFDLIVSNPPYIANRDPHLSQGDLRFEPPEALASGDDGLRDIRHIVAHAPRHLEAGGWLLFEHGYQQGPAARQALQGAGFTQVYTQEDLAGLERLSAGKYPLDLRGIKAHD